MTIVVPEPPQPSDLEPYAQQTWIDVTDPQNPPPGALREDAESFNRMEAGIGRAQLVAVASWLLASALQGDVEGVQADLTALAANTASDIAAAVAGLVNTAQATALAQTAAAAAVSEVIGGAPEAANTLRELKDLLDANATGDAGTAAALSALVTVVAGKATPQQIADAVAGLAAVARTGSYADLTGKPTIPAAPDLTPYVTKTDAAATYRQTRPVTLNERQAVPKLTKYPSLQIGTLAQIGLPSIYVPWMIRVPDAVFAAYPQYGRWRVYTSTDHDNGAGGIAIGVCGSDADVMDPTKWTWLRNSGSAVMFTEGGTTQIETPCVVWNPDTQLFHMYYQRANGTTQMTKVATSPDGVTNWTVVGVAIPNLPSTIAGWNHTGYARVYYLDGLWAAWHLQGSGVGVSGYGWSFSKDGLVFLPDRRRVNAAIHMTDGVLRLGISTLFRYNETLWALGSQTEYVSGAATSGLTNVWAAPINLTDDLRSLRGRPQRLSWPQTSPETSQAGPPTAFATHPDGRLIGAYRINGDTGALALAVLS